MNALEKHRKQREAALARYNAFVSLVIAVELGVLLWKL